MARKNFGKGETSYTQELDFTETANWNSAQLYSEVAITKYLLDADKFRLIATYGSLDIETSILQNIPKQILIRARYNALIRYHDTIRTIIDNSYFALRVKDREQIDPVVEKLEKLEPIIEKVIDRKGGKETLNEALFKDLLEVLRGILKEIKTPLNKSDLIFGHKEEFDPTKFKESVKDNIINVG